MTLTDYLPRLRRRPRVEPTQITDGPTYVRHGVVVPALPERDDVGGGWGHGYLEAHAEADRRDAEIAARRRERSIELRNGLEEAAHQRRMDALRRANDEADSAETLARTRRIVAALTAEAAPAAAAPPPVEEKPDPTGEATTGEVPVQDADPDYSRVPAEQLTKPAARVEARRLTAAGVRVPQNARDLAALQDLIRKARAALGEETA